MQTNQDTANRKLGSLLRNGKRLFPDSIKKRLKNSRYFVRYRSQWTNVYHCTVYRTGSQWLRRILSDREVRRYSGLQYEMYFQRIFSTEQVRDQTVNYPSLPYSKAFPENQIIGLYASCSSFQQIPREQPSRVFFVLRDPRDIVISHYYSWRRDSYNRNTQIYDQIREPEAGISKTIQSLYDMALFSAIQSWVSIQMDDPNLLLLRYEDLTGSRQLEMFQKLFTFCDIGMPDNSLEELLYKNRFEALSGGRQPGNEDPDSHYHKGISGDWVNHFTKDHIALFQETTGNLVSDCGYSW